MTRLATGKRLRTCAVIVLVSGPRDLITIRHAGNWVLSRAYHHDASKNRGRAATGATSPCVSVARGFAASSLVTRRLRDVIPFRRLPLIRIPVPGGCRPV
jgi:hypothetical protein